VGQSVGCDSLIRLHLDFASFNFPLCSLVPNGLFSRAIDPKSCLRAKRSQDLISLTWISPQPSLYSSILSPTTLKTYTDQKPSPRSDYLGYLVYIDFSITRKLISDDDYACNASYGLVVCACCRIHVQQH